MVDLAPHVGERVRIHTADWYAEGVLRHRDCYVLDGASVTYPDFRALVITEEHVTSVESVDDMVTVSRADLDQVVNRAGDPQVWATYPAACQRIRDALDGGGRG